MKAGIDYGLGSTNVDHETGIRYGCISQHLIGQAWADSSEPQYACDRCDCDDWTRERCDADPIGWTVKDHEYEMVDCLDSDVLVIKSPFCTFGPYCSPCVPGAVNLNDAGDFFEPVNGVLVADTPPLDVACLPQAYCPGHDWFEDGKAPYPVFGVITLRQCFPDEWYCDGPAYNVSGYTVIDGNRNQRGHFDSRADAQRYLNNAPEWLNRDRAYVQPIHRVE